MNLRRPFRNAIRSGTTLYATVEEINLGKATVRVGGTRFTNLSTIGGPVAKGDTVIIDYGAGTPPIVRPQFLVTPEEPTPTSIPGPDKEAVPDPVSDVGCLTIMDYEMGPDWYNVAPLNVPYTLPWRDNCPPDYWVYAEIFDSGNLFNETVRHQPTFTIPQDGKYIIWFCMGYCNVYDNVIEEDLPENYSGYTYIEIAKNNIPVARTSNRWEENETSTIQLVHCTTIEPCKKGDKITARVNIVKRPGGFHEQMNYLWLDYDTNYGNPPIFFIQKIADSTNVQTIGGAGGGNPPPVPPNPDLPPEEQPPLEVPAKEFPWIQHAHMRVQPDGLGYIDAYMFAGISVKDRKCAFCKGVYSLYPTWDIDDLFPSYYKMLYPLDTRAGVESQWEPIDNDQDTGILKEYISGYGLGTIDPGTWLLQGDVNYMYQAGSVVGLTKVLAHFYKKKDNGTETLIWEGDWFAVAMGTLPTVYYHYQCYPTGLPSITFAADERLLLRITWLHYGPYYSPYHAPLFHMMLYDGGHSYLIPGTSWTPQLASATKHAYMPVPPQDTSSTKHAALMAPDNFTSIYADTDFPNPIYDFQGMIGTITYAPSNILLEDYDAGNLHSNSSIIYIKAAGIYEIIAHCSWSVGNGQLAIRVKSTTDYTNTTGHFTDFGTTNSTSTSHWVGYLEANAPIYMTLLHRSNIPRYSLARFWAPHLIVRRLDA